MNIYAVLVTQESMMGVIPGITTFTKEEYAEEYVRDWLRDNPDSHERYVKIEIMEVTLFDHPVRLARDPNGIPFSVRESE